MIITGFKGGTSPVVRRLSSREARHEGDEMTMSLEEALQREKVLVNQYQDRALIAEKQVAELQNQVEELRAALEISKWRPIEEIHEDMGPCVMMRLDDPGYLVVGSNLDEDFNEPGFTHFAQVPKLTIKEAEALAEKPDTKETK